MRITISLLTLAASATIAAAQSSAERYVVIVNGERIGHLHVNRNGNQVETDFLIDDNGRGPKIRESWRLGPGRQRPPYAARVHRRRGTDPGCPG